MIQWHTRLRQDFSHPVSWGKCKSMLPLFFPTPHNWQEILSRDAASHRKGNLGTACSISCQGKHHLVTHWKWHNLEFLPLRWSYNFYLMAANANTIFRVVFHSQWFLHIHLKLIDNTQFLAGFSVISTAAKLDLTTQRDLCQKKLISCTLLKVHRLQRAFPSFFW